MKKMIANCLKASCVALACILFSQYISAGKSPFPILHGNMVSNSTWSGLDNKDVPRGIYRLPVKTNLVSEDFTSVVTHPYMNGLSGGAVFDNVYHAIVSHPMPGIQYSTTYYAEFDLDEGRLLTDELTSSAMHIALNTTTEPETGTVYGIFYGDEWQQTYEFGTIDYRTLTRGEDKFKVTQPYILAAAGNGVIYAIGYDDGFFYKLNLEKKEFDKIGDTGLGSLKFYENQWTWYAYPQSLIYDSSSNKLYWAEYRRTDWNAYESNLYEVNPENGAVTLLSKMPDLIEMTNLYIPWQPADDAPDDIESLQLDFAFGSNSGKVSFTIPSKTYAGDKLEGDVKCYIVANGDTISTVVEKAGTALNVPVTLTDGGSTYFKVSASNSAGSGNHIGKRIWIGNDYPQAINTVVAKLDKATGIVNISWDKVDSPEGVNGGYVDLANIRYKITRYPDEVVVADDLVEDTYTDHLVKRDMQSYYYAVEAINGIGFSSEATLSERCIFGNPFATPYFDDVDGTVSHYLYTIHDGNSDGVTWQAQESTTVLTETRWEYNPAGTLGESDEWLVTPALYLSPDSLYRFSFGVATTTVYYNSRVEAAFGKDADNILDFDRIIEPTTFNNNSRNKIFLGNNIHVEEAGAYHFGMHAINESAQGIIVVDSISVKSLGLIGAPGMVESIQVAVADNGANNSTISFITPTKTSTGDALTWLGYVEVYRDGSLIATVKDVTPGNTYTVNDDGEGITPGFHSYTAIAYNDKGKGLVADAVNAWFGADSPLKPVDVLLKDNFDGTFTVTWDVPDEGVHGGYVDKSALKFTVNKVSATNWVQGVLASGIDKFSYTGELPACSQQQDFMYVGVSATLDGKTFTERVQSNGIQYGTPNTLPFVESAKNGQFQNAGTLALFARDFYTGFRASSGKSVDDDGGSILFTTYNVGAWAKLSTGMIALEGSSDPKLTYSWYAVPGNNAELKVDVIKANGLDSIAVSDINLGDVTGDEGWRTETISLSPWLGEHHVYVCFTGTIKTSGAQVCVDHIEVSDRKLSGIDSVYDNDSIIVSAESGFIIVKSPLSTPINVYGVNGNVVYTGLSGNDITRINVAQGFYIVVAGDRRMTVMVR